MTRGQSETTPTTADWPRFGLTYTYNPSTDLALSLDLQPDELVVFESDDDAVEGRWITAERGIPVPIEDVR